MAGCDRGHPTQLTHSSHRLVVEIPDRIPQQVAGRCAHKMRVLTDSDLRLDRDPKQIGLELDHAHVASFSAQLLESRPLLSVRRYPLALIGADRADSDSLRVLH